MIIFPFINSNMQHNHQYLLLVTSLYLSLVSYVVCTGTVLRGLVRVIIPMALWVRVGLGFIILYFGCVIIVGSDIIGLWGLLDGM